MKKLAFIALIVSNIFALEFGQLGNTPESVGGAGVAYKKNAWAVYYNPALLGANRKASIAYSFGFGYADSNVLELASIDINALKNIKDEVNGLTKKTTTVTTRKIQARNGGGQTRANGTSWNFTDLGLLGDVLGNLTATNGGTGGTKGTSDADLKTYLCKYYQNGGGGTNGCTSKQLNEIAQGLDDSKLGTIKSELQSAIKKTAETNPNNPGLDILDNIVENLNPSDIKGLVEGLKDGTADLSTIINKIGGGIKISKGTSPALDSLFTIVDTINKNGLNISSNNGIAWHIKGSKNRGAIGMGLIANVYGFAGVELDSTHKKIIINGSSGNGGGNGNYFEVGTDGDKITISSSKKETFESSSVLSSSANHKLHANGLLIAEIPVAYGHTIALPIGDLHLGATLKYIFATSMDNSQKFDFDNLKIDFGNISNNLRYTHTFGIDLGALYTMKWLGVGLVAKNLNAPQINTANGKYRILPQVRAGFSAEVWKLTFLLDMDLTPNKTLEPNKFNQMVGGGVILDLNWVDFRFGVMGDMHKNPYGPIFTMGMNIVHFLDFSLQTSAKLVDLGQYTNGVRMPNYFKLNLGGRFQW